MDILILSVFAIVVVLSFIEDYMSVWQKMIILFTVGIALICLSTFKPMTTADASNYEIFFYNNDDTFIEVSTEPTYIYMSRLYLSFGLGITAIFFTYALLSIPLKLVLLWKVTTPYVFTAMIVYVGVYFPLHDVVQIRCGVAVAFVLLALIPLAERQYLKAYALLVVATLFHYSSLAFLPIFLVGNMKINKYWKYLLAAAIPIYMLLYLAGFSAFSLIPKSLIEGKLDIYKDMSDAGYWDKYIPYKQIPFLAEFGLLCFFLYFYDTIEKHCKYAHILIKAIALEIGYLFMFAEVEVLGNRLHELFGMFNVLAYTQLLYIIKPRYAVRIGLAAFSLIYYLAQMYNEVYFH